MENSVLNQVLPSQGDHRPAVAEATLASISDKGIIIEKIQEMTKSLVQATTLSISKPMEMLRKLQSNRQKLQMEVSTSQKGMFDNLNSLQQGLLTLDRQRLLQQANSKIMEQQINEHLQDCEEHLKKMGDFAHEKISQYSESISNAKIQIVQTETISKEKAARLQRDTEHKLHQLEKNHYSNDIKLNGVRQKIKKKFKELKVSIEDEGRQIQKQIIRAQLVVNELEQSLFQKIHEQQLKQKESFQQNYHALEEIFKLLSHQVHNGY